MLNRGGGRHGRRPPRPVTGISEERQEQSIMAGKRVKRQADINPKREKQS